MVADRVGAQEQLLGDLAVGETLVGHAGDLKLLGVGPVPDRVRRLAGIPAPTPSGSAT